MWSYFIIAAALYLWAGVCILVFELINNRKEAKLKKHSEEVLVQKAKDLIKSDISVRKIYIAIRIQHIKSKHSKKVTLLEQRLRVLVREKALRQEILRLARRKNVQI